MSPTELPPLNPPETRSEAMSVTLARNWWAVALRGVFGIIFGVLTFVMPIVTLATLVYLFAGYLIVDGVFAIVAAVRAAEKHERWGWLVVEGVVDLLAAVAMVVNPALAIVFMVYLIAFWSILSGLLMTIAAFQLHMSHGRWFLVLGGLVSVLFGMLLAGAPITGAVVLAYWLGAYALVFGALLIGLAFRLRSWRPRAQGV